MQIKDYELINDIRILFDKKIVIYGIGFWGKHIFHLLTQAGIPISLVCDQNANMKEYGGIPIVIPDTLKDLSNLDEYMVVIGSERYKKEMLEVLLDMGKEDYVYTWYGVQTAVALNLDNKKFSREFAEDYRFRRKVYHDNFESSYWLQHFLLLCRSYSPILIYQPAKVGSSTIKRTLDEWKIENIHLHNFITNLGREKGLCNDIISITDEQAEYFQKQISFNGVKIITLVREPIARQLSLFMQEFHEFYILHDINKPLLEYVNEYVSNRVLANEEFEWFNNEIKQLTGIDVYEYPFDREKGYTIIRKDNIEILVLKMEMLSHNEKIIGEFVGKADLQLINSNVGLEKHYQYIYKELKKDFHISKEVIEEVYRNNLYFEHFYTSEEINVFLEKWKENIE